MVRSLILLNFSFVTLNLHSLGITRELTCISSRYSLGSRVLKRFTVFSGFINSSLVSPLSSKLL